jgi:hypothetical protein
MDTLKQLNSDIIKITMEIKKQYPELSKYILEMPVTVPNLENPEMNRKALQEYYDSLKILLKDYNTNT